MGKYFPFGYVLLDISSHLTETLKYLFCLLNNHINTDILKYIY